MSRFISITLVENLTKNAIIVAFEKHRYRFGPTKTAHTDRGTNYVGAQAFLRENPEEVLSAQTMKEVQQAAKSKGLTIVTRVSKAPYQVGSAERSVAIVKRLWPKRNMTFFEVEYMIERVMFSINQRPLSMSNCGQDLCPNDLRPLYSNLPQEAKTQSFIAGYETLQRTIEEFEQAWSVLYSYAIVGMKKWLTDSVTLEPGDLVAVDDIKPGHQQLALVESVKPDTNEHPRYFEISYVQGGKRKYIMRPGSSLCFLQSAEDRANGVIRDPLSYIPENVRMSKAKLPIKVSVDTRSPTIQDLS